jgi:hypothetical protein
MCLYTRPREIKKNKGKFYCLTNKKIKLFKFVQHTSALRDIKEAIMIIYKPLNVK